MTKNTEKFAEFITCTAYESLPSKGIEIAKQGIIDCIGVTLRGKSAPGSKIVAEYVKKSEGSGECGVIGYGFNAEASAAALANGTLAHMLDYDDVSLLFGGHPSVVLLPAILAVGQKLRCSGKEVLLAYIVGFEVATRIGAACFTRHYELGWHTTATFGTIAAAAAAAQLSKLDTGTCKNALGIAASLSSGLKRNFGTMTKPFHAGNASKNGIVAVDLAKQGFTADENIFDDTGNYVQVFGGGVDANLNLQNLGDEFDICDGIEIKPYPSCRGTHGGIDAALALRENHAVTPDDIAEIEFSVSPFIPLACFHHHPQTGWEGKFCLEFCAALAFHEGKVNLDQFTSKKVTQPDFQEFMKKIRLRVDDRIPTTDMTPVSLRVKLKNDEILFQEVESAKGEPNNPLSHRELSAKFKDCASEALLPGEVDKVLNMLSNLESLGDIDHLMEILTFQIKKYF